MQTTSSCNSEVLGKLVCVEKQACHYSMGKLTEIGRPPFLLGEAARQKGSEHPERVCLQALVLPFASAFELSSGLPMPTPGPYWAFSPSLSLPPPTPLPRFARRDLYSPSAKSPALCGGTRLNLSATGVDACLTKPKASCHSAADAPAVAASPCFLSQGRWRAWSFASFASTLGS